MARFSGPWPAGQIERFLADATIPLRLAYTTGSGWPSVVSEWTELFSRAVGSSAESTQNFRSLRLPLVAAGLSFVGSVCAWFLVDHATGIFIGLRVPSILALSTLLNVQPR